VAYSAQATSLQVATIDTTSCSDSVLLTVLFDVVVDVQVVVVALLTAVAVVTKSGTADSHSSDCNSSSSTSRSIYVSVSITTNLASNEPRLVHVSLWDLIAPCSQVASSSDQRHVSINIFVEVDAMQTEASK
jgi:hypothetical protein